MRFKITAKAQRNWQNGRYENLWDGEGMQQLQENPGSSSSKGQNQGHNGWGAGKGKGKNGGGKTGGKGKGGKKKPSWR